MNDFESTWRARRTDPDTSHEGAMDVAERAPAYKKRLLLQFVSNDLTAVEAADRADLPQGGWKRVSELHLHHRFIEPTGTTRVNPSGSSARVFRITPLGLAMALVSESRWPKTEHQTNNPKSKEQS